MLRLIVTSQIQPCVVNDYEVPGFLCTLCLIQLCNHGGMHSCADYLISVNFSLYKMSVTHSLARVL